MANLNFQTMTLKNMANFLANFHLRKLLKEERD